MAGTAPADDKPSTAEVDMLVDACHRLRADAVALEFADHATVVVINPYDGTYATAFCDHGAQIPSVARGLQVRLYSEPPFDRPIDVLPAVTVRSALDRWEGRIAIVFGPLYASRLVANATRLKVPGEISYDDLERIRLRLCYATGGCLDLQKVDK